MKIVKYLNRLLGKHHWRFLGAGLMNIMTGLKNPQHSTWAISPVLSCSKYPALTSLYQDFTRLLFHLFFQKLVTISKTTL